MLALFDHVIAQREMRAVLMLNRCAPNRLWNRGRAGGVNAIITLTLSGFETVSFSIITVFELAFPPPFSGFIFKVQVGIPRFDSFSKEVLGFRVSKHFVQSVIK